jgi:hypothetical protein
MLVFVTDDAAYRTFKEVCTAEPTPWEQQLGQFGSHGERGVDMSD